MSLAESDAALAARLAAAAGDILLSLRSDGRHVGEDLGKAGDEAANEYLIRELRNARPFDAILSEEEQDSAERLDHRRVWIIYPLDGTREYSEGRDDWAVHVGLSVGGRAEIGAVALPALQLVLTSDQPRSLPAPPAKPRMLVSRTRPAAEAIFVAEKMGADLLAMGSAGAKAMAVVRGEAEIYLHTGGQFEWDNCAPVAVAAAAGLHVSRADGSPLVYNNRDTYLPDLLICRAEYANDVLRLAAEYSAAG